MKKITQISRPLSRIFCPLLLSAQLFGAAPDFDRGSNPERHAGETESEFRRGEVIFFISYPFTFLGSLAVYQAAAAGISALDTGRSEFASGAGFYALVATTAAFLSFGIAMNDYYTIKTEARMSEANLTSYLLLDYRF